MDNEAKVKAVEEKLEEVFKIIEVPESISTLKTPHRIAKMWVNEVFKNMNDNNIEELNNQMTCFPAERGTGKRGL